MRIAHIPYSSVPNNFFGCLGKVGYSTLNLAGSGVESTFMVGISARNCNKIYKGLDFKYDGTNALTGSEYNDVTCKSISISRYLKVF